MLATRHFIRQAPLPPRRIFTRAEPGPSGGLRKKATALDPAPIAPPSKKRLMAVR
jgi:hypothetical protein